MKHTITLSYANYDYQMSLTRMSAKEYVAQADVNGEPYATYADGAEDAFTALAIAIVLNEHGGPDYDWTTHLIAGKSWLTVTFDGEEWAVDAYETGDTGDGYITGFERWIDAVQYAVQALFRLKEW